MRQPRETPASCTFTNENDEKSDEKTTRKLVRNAYHEAGHTVVLYRTAGHPSDYVTIVRRREENSIILGAAFDGVSDSLSPEDMEATILSCYAGGHAQREFDPGCGVEGCDLDDAQADEQLRLHGWEHREQELRERSLANELLQFRVLDDAEVQAISDAAAGDPDAKRDLARYRAMGGQGLEQWRKRQISSRRRSDF